MRSLLRACWLLNVGWNMWMGSVPRSRCHPQGLASLWCRPTAPECGDPVNGAARGSTAGQEQGQCPGGTPS